MAAETTQAVGERLLALVEPEPGSQRLVRRAWRSAQRLGAQLDLLWVAAPGRTIGPEQERALAALRQLGSVLGATLLVQPGDDVAATVAEVARQRGSTYIQLGRSRPARGLARLRTPLPQRLMEALPGVDVRIVADRSDRHERTP
jgi:two-component system sensor histidine kinase KdpD